ncbi:pyridoxal-phosphate dependent enzyme [Fulvivirgaceae bacterium BMA12]|uniref:Pyridoxal-phosphate dependent enzyme n=1 Tax=Agaribacillus aureus TaxID=3051825 RepID=A0ABT8LHK2_9BACT|nr:pyridoxal-phosphate dependent enzyme [Fulvivirgaceae bacterium BMA12]
MTILTKNIPTADIIVEAHERIKPFVHQTPVMTSQSINAISGARLYFKCENFQKVGAFKFRGATNAVFSLNEDERQKGVATHSSGNHGQGLALAAKMQKIPAYIVMPENAPRVKRLAVEGSGAEVIPCKNTLASREETLQKVVEQTGAITIHPFDDYRIIAGQATAAKELIEEQGQFDVIMTPVGGGGLLSGTALTCHYWSPLTKVIAGEPSGADDAIRSMKAGTIIPCPQPSTIADGLLTTICERTFGIIKDHVSDIISVTDDEIVAAMRLIWERMKIIVEPSAAVPVAALLKNKEEFKGKKIGIILTGGNVDLDKLPFR